MRRTAKSHTHAHQPVVAFGYPWVLTEITPGIKTLITPQQLLQILPSAGKQAGVFSGQQKARRKPGSLVL
jgi:hypothetical protein